MLEVPTSTHKIDAQWLSLALKQNGLLKGDIASLRLETIGEGVGLMGELARLHLTYEEAEELPPTIVAKCAAQNENREVARILDFYNREVNFYNELGQSSPIRVPTSYYGAVEPTTYDCVVLMEDLGDVSPRDQLIGASEEEVFSAVGEIAKLHALMWGRRSQHNWMFDMMSDDEAARLQELVYQPALESAIEKFGYLLNDKTRTILREVGDRFPEFWAQNFTDVETFIHGDYRQDNMLYTQGRPDALVLDWQISGLGKPAFDLAYFMSQSVQSDLRASVEKELIKFYCAQLSELGVVYPEDHCFEDYRRYFLGCLVYPVTVCGSLDLANERGRALGETMMQRNLVAIEDLGAEQLL